ncbi:MAG TPA: YqaJ viral recombinase family protein [Spirillospora sp.]|nr:YqaJ viral recombinase family protein [Spirillospora sp.]
MNAVPLPDLVPGSPEWMTRMTASKVAAVLGLSPWESRFSLWHRMAGLVPPQEETTETRRGHYLEDAVAQWFADQHPADFQLGPGGAWAHAERNWQAASPDRILWPWDCNEIPCPYDRPRALLEIKTTADDSEWGIAGSDEIPPYYRAQVVWQLDTLGLSTAYVAVLLPRLEFREYRIEYNPDEAAYIRAEARAFLDTLPGGPNEQRPDLDAHSATYVAVQQLHPEINGEDCPVPDHIGREFCDAVRTLNEAKAREQAARTALADHMGDAKRAVWLGKTIADRRPGKNGGTPYMQAASHKRLPVETVEEIAS